MPSAPEASTNSDAPIVGEAPVAGQDNVEAPVASSKPTAKEIGGRDGLEPTRFGDWERAGRCIDF